MVWLACCFAMLADASETVVLRVQGLPNDAAADPASLAEQNVVARFRELHPGIEVQPAEGLRLATLNSEASTIMMIAGGIAPDVIRMNFRSSDTYIRQGIAAPLGSFLSQEQDGGAAILAAIPPQILPVVCKSVHTENPELYGLPLQTVVSGLYYNKSLFRRAGLPLRAPRDWEELLTFARKINALGAPARGLFLQSGPSASFSLMNFIRAAGGDAVVEEAADQWRAAFHSPEALEAYLFYYKLVAEGLAYRTPGTPKEEVLGQMGMVFRYVGDTVLLDPERWGFGAVPKGPGDAGGSEINAGILAVFSGIQDAKRKEAAWQYIRFVTSAEADRLRIATLTDLGLASSINPASLRKHGFSEYLIMSPKGLEAEFADALATGKPEPYGRNCNLIYQEMTYPLDEMLLSPTLRKAMDAGDWEAMKQEASEILSRAANRTNERMMGHVPPETLRWRRQVAAVVVGVMGGIFIFVGRATARAFSGAAARLPQAVAGKGLAPWLCLLPATLLILAWSYLPLVRGTWIAFLDYQILLRSAFVGLDNFANVLFDSSFWNSLLATLHFAAWTLSLGFFAPILLAYLLHLIPKHKVLFRTLYYLPAVISGTAVFFLWKELFDVDGVLNRCLRLFGLEAAMAWPESPHLAMLACVIPGIWAGTGPGCLIYLAALKTIPEEQFEASEIDGAGFWSKTRHIVFPSLKALILINFVGAVAAAFHGATNVMIMTGGGPNGMTEVTSLKIFYEAFARLRFGPATAMAWIIGSMLVGFTVFQLRRLSRMEFKTAR